MGLAHSVRPILRGEAMAKRTDPAGPSQSGWPAIIKSVADNRQFFVVTLLLLEAAFGVTIYALPEAQRFLAFIVFLVVILIVGFFALGFLSNDEEERLTAPKDIIKALTNNDLRYLLALEKRRENHFVGAEREVQSDGDLDIERLGRRVLSLTDKGLLRISGHFGVGLTDLGVATAKAIRADKSGKYKEALGETT
jgi:hypothetical protein